VSGGDVVRRAPLRAGELLLGADPRRLRKDAHVRQAFLRAFAEQPAVAGTRTELKLPLAAYLVAMQLVDEWERPRWCAELFADGVHRSDELIERYRKWDTTKPGEPL
jgi:hypothetical protein